MVNRCRHSIRDNGNQKTSGPAGGFLVFKYLRGTDHYTAHAAGNGVLKKTERQTPNRSLTKPLKTIKGPFSLFREKSMGEHIGYKTHELVKGVFIV